MEKADDELEKHIKSWGIMREAEVIEKAEGDLDHAIETCHREGLSYWLILKIFSGFIQQLIMRADAEYYSKGGK